jgi:hypothetical protein
MKTRYHSYGVDYEVPIGVATARKLLNGKPLPRMGYEIAIATGADQSRLFLDNTSGSYWVASSVWPRTKWREIYGVDFRGMVTGNRPKRNPVRDPSHKKLLRGLSKHFAMDEAALRRMKKNPSRGEFDQHAATELVIYADNTRELVPQKEAIARNLLRKIRAGTYDSTRAVVAWRHWIDAAAKRYAKEFGTGNMAEIFSVPTREWAAREIAHRNQLMLNAGEWDWILAKKNPGRKHHSAKWRRCVRKVKKRGGAASPYAVCTKAVGNPRGFVIVAWRRGETLYFDGKKHFSDRHKPHIFATHEAAFKRGQELVRAYGDALARYRITVEPAPGK